MFTPRIEQIYFRYDEAKSGSSEESREALDKCRKEFIRQNPNIAREATNNAVDAVISYGEVHRREGFIDGFRYAVKLMAEVYAGHSTPADRLPQ